MGHKKNKTEGIQLRYLRPQTELSDVSMVPLHSEYSYAISIIRGLVAILKRKVTNSPFGKYGFTFFCPRTYPQVEHLTDFSDLV